MPHVSLPRVPRRVSVRLVAIAATALAIAGCTLDVGDPTLATPADPLTTSYSPGLNVNINAMTRLNAQLFIQDSVIGTGRAAVPGTATYSGDSLSAYYTLWLPDGSQLDRRAAPAAPFRFLLDSTRVILGWTRGLNGMRAGGIRKLVVGPGNGYGNSPPQGIPRNSVLVFTVQLIAADTGRARVTP